jgi:hypothetical protein
MDQQFYYASLSTVTNMATERAFRRNEHSILVHCSKHCDTAGIAGLGTWEQRWLPVNVRN